MSLLKRIESARPGSSPGTPSENLPAAPGGAGGPGGGSPVGAAAAG